MLLFIDVETTCWEKKGKRDLNEIIELGGVISTPDRKIISTFSEFVRPNTNKQLSGFCKDLTGIKQSDIDEAESFALVANNFVDWFFKETKIDLKNTLWFSWGNFDERAIKKECTRYGYPYMLGRHMDLQQMYSHIRQCGLISVTDALEREKLDSEGRPHRALVDAANIAKIASKVL